MFYCGHECNYALAHRFLFWSELIILCSEHFMIGVYFANLFMQFLHQALKLILVLLNNTLRICIVFVVDAEIGESSLSGLNSPLPSIS